MPLSSHTTSLPLSLALREAGYKQEGALFYWYRSGATGDKWILVDAKGFETPINELIAQGNVVVAPLASELMAELPHDLWKSKENDGYCLSITKVEEDDYYANYEANSDGSLAFYFEDGFNEKTVPNALAKLWLHIHSQKII